MAVAGVGTGNGSLTIELVTSVALISSLNPSQVGQPVTLTAVVSQASSTGSMTFRDGSAVLCNAVPVAGGVATCTTTFTTLGAHSLTASFLATGAATPATSSALIQTVSDQVLRTAQAIGQFLSARNNQILTNGPDGQRDISRLVEAGGGTADGTDAGGGSGFAAGGTADTITQQGGRGATPARLGDGPNPDASRLPGSAALANAAFGARPIGDAIEANASGSARATQMNGETGAGSALVLNGLRAFGTFEGAARFGFSTSLREMTRAAAEADQQKLAAAGLGLTSQAGKPSGSRANPFDVWIEGKYVGVTDERTSGNVDSRFGLLSIGADYVLNPSLLVGTMVQLDTMQQRSNAKQTDVRGHGWMAGPYATVRLSQNVFFQVRGAWGQSSNTVSPYQTYADSFDTDRWLVTSTLSGRWQSGQWSFRPSASIAYIEDTSKSYTDTFGSVIPSVKSTLGQAKAGPEVGYRIDVGNAVIEPYAGVQVIWNFADDTTAAGLGSVGSVGGEASGPGGVRGRVEAGMRAKATSGTSVDLSGSYDGIGTGSYSAVSGKATVRLPLN